MDLRYEDYAKLLFEAFDMSAPPEQRKAAEIKLTELPKAYTREADYVWLPLRFDGEMAYIDWHDQWKLSDFE